MQGKGRLSQPLGLATAYVIFTAWAIQVLGLGLLFAATAASPAWAGKLDGQGKLDGPTRQETLASPKDTQGELVKAPASAPTKPAVAKGPKPTANIKEGQDLVSNPVLSPCKITSKYHQYKYETVSR